MQNLCHTLSLFHACSLNNYWLLQPKHVCFIILGLMPVVVTCMYLLYKFFRFCLYNMHLLVWKTCIQQGKVWHGFSCSLNMPTGLQNGIDIAFFWIWPKRPKPTSTTCVPLSEIFHKDLDPKILTLSQEKGRFAQSLNMALGVGMASKRSHFSSWKDSWWKWQFFVGWWRLSSCNCLHHLKCKQRFASNIPSLWVEGKKQT